jgi:hypothetical protein
MQVQNSKQEEIISILNNSKTVNRHSSELKDLISKIDNRIINLIKNVPLGALDVEFLNELDKNYFNDRKYEYHTKVNIWAIYNTLSGYIQANNDEKSNMLEEIIKPLNKEKPLINPAIIDRLLIEKVYTSGDEKLIDFYSKKFPIPPLFIFDPDQQPKFLVDREADRVSHQSEFNLRNEGDYKLSQKIKYIQRFIRAKLRLDSEIERIGNRYFKNELDADLKATQLIEDANTPYKPQKCSPELAKRIMREAYQIKLFPSVSHLLAAHNVAQILDGCLYGRENLINSYTNFRTAALYHSDIENGDGNVICLGPDKIDTQCLKGDTLGLELDLEMLSAEDNYNKNPAIFFKQLDLGYDIKQKQTIKIKDKEIVFTHTASLRCQNPNCANLQLFDKCDFPQYYAEVQKDSLISNNVRQMNQILVLNFFRFLDNLRDTYCRMAPYKTKEIYEEISKLDDSELHNFLLDLGRKMSCSSEFNIYGAYQIDLNALRSISIYSGVSKVDAIKMNDLYAELNNQKFYLLNKLKHLAPQIFQSANFLKHLKSKVENTAALEEISNRPII